MTERLSDVEARIGTVNQLSAVIAAMRGIAAARAREARGRVDGIRAYAGMIAHAVSQALAFLPEVERRHIADPGDGGGGRGARGHAIIVLTAEQGFAGTFSERVLEAADAVAVEGGEGGVERFLIGDRGLSLAEERGSPVAWSAPMVAHAAQAPVLAGRIVDALYDRIEAGRIARVTVVHAVPGGAAAVETTARRLVPFDVARFPPATDGIPPVLTLPPADLLARLIEEYVFAELCEAVTLSFAAENEARMRAMIAAKTNVEATLGTLVARSRQLRQEEITNEIVELAASSSTIA